MWAKRRVSRAPQPHSDLREETPGKPEFGVAKDTGSVIIQSYVRICCRVSLPVPILFSAKPDDEALVGLVSGFEVYLRRAFGRIVITGRLPVLREAEPERCDP